jgi:hypothetical protein
MKFFSRLVERAQSGVNAWNVAAKTKDKAEPVSTFFKQDDRQGNRRFQYFDGLMHRMEEMVPEGFAFPQSMVTQKFPRLLNS